MKVSDLFINSVGRLRSGWRLAVFLVAYVLVLRVLGTSLYFVAAMLLPRASFEWLFESNFGFVVQSVVLFIPAALVGWVCNLALEGLPWRALGWALHRGWVRDLALGLLAGAVAIGVAAAVGWGAGGYRFTLAPEWGAVARTFAFSGFVFMLGAAAEEMLFRGYPLQTLMRSWPLWLAVLPTSVPFALVHLDNPNASPLFTFTNTALAGVWLAVAYARTRSLWFPFGLHWGWNWAQGALLGSPVSGITELTPAPLLRFADNGPAWLGGGPYGIEGGAACTLALVAATLFTWRTRLVKETPELREFTDGENPSPRGVLHPHGGSESVVGE